MKKALESHGGLRGCRVAVVEIDPSKDRHEAIKIPDISLLYNFKFEDSEIRVWKAYNIGEGKLLKYKNLQIQPQDIASLVVIGVHFHYIYVLKWTVKQIAVC